MQSLVNARKIANYIRTLTDLDWEESEYTRYQHMGAVLSDAGLQSGLNYRTVVYPRIDKVLRCWPEADTTSKFLQTSSKWGLDYMLNWSHPEKPRRILDMASFLVNQGIETEAELKTWLNSFKNRTFIQQVKGVGPKTVDYLYKLVGGEAIPIDRHLKNFASLAGINNSSYSDMEITFRYTADLLEMNYSAFDKMIWNYMTNKSSKDC